jgi:NAD(P)-dependent dehydrogenase (short-subunit alcohol dehydrogenase family)
VADEDQVATAVATVLERFGGLDALHHNAGIATPAKPLHQTTAAEFDRLLRVNLVSILYTVRNAFDALCASKGSILCTSSLVGEIGQSDHAAYAASKGGVNALVKSMALDYAAQGVRVNAVSPAGVWTPMLRRWCAEQVDPSGIERYLDLIHPLGHCPEGDVIADAAVFLLSDRARFITGTILPVSGGAELGYRRP